MSVTEAKFSPSISLPSEVCDAAEVAGQLRDVGDGGEAARRVEGGVDDPNGSAEVHLQHDTGRLTPQPLVRRQATSRHP